MLIAHDCAFMLNAEGRTGADARGAAGNHQCGLDAGRQGAYTLWDDIL